MNENIFFKYFWDVFLIKQIVIKIRKIFFKTCIILLSPEFQGLKIIFSASDEDSSTLPNVYKTNEYNIFFIYTFDILDHLWNLPSTERCFLFLLFTKIICVFLFNLNRHLLLFVNII